MYDREEWLSIGRIIAKGYVDLQYFPTHLALAFSVVLILGEDAITSDVLKESYLDYITPPEKEELVKALNGQDYDPDIILDITSQANCHSIPDPLEPTGIQIAHKMILQEPKYALDSMIDSARPSLHVFFKDVNELKQLYDAAKPTASRVIPLLEAQLMTQEESTVLGYLQKFIRARNSQQLSYLLRLMTTADMLCVQNIRIEFVHRYGLGRAPTFHTCGPTVQLPTNYRN